MSDSTLATPTLATPTPSQNVSLGPRTRKPYNTSQGVSQSNIIEGRRAPKPRRQAYLAHLEQPEALIPYYTAFLVNRLANTRNKLHRDELPDPPRTWKEAQKHLHSAGFTSAAQKELAELDRKGTWRLVDSKDIDSTIKPLPLKWVFAYKFDKDGFLDRYKARICVRGDLQPPSDRDKYAATLAARIFRCLMAITAKFGLKAAQLDAVNAFINGELDKTVYTLLPDGFRIPSKLWWILKALYGLRRSPLI